MKKQLKNKEALNNYISNMYAEMYAGLTKVEIMQKQLAITPDPDFTITEEKIVNRLTSEGYNLDDLLEDGRAYQLLNHTNNGWLYEDEADLVYIAQTGRTVELRKRG